MRLLRVIFFCLFSLIISSTAAFALSIVSQDPHFEMFENFTIDPMRVVFNDSVNPSTVTNASVYINYENSPSTKIDVTFSFETTTLTNDTLVITPTANDNKWPFAKRLNLNITSGLTSMSSSAFDGAYPFGQLFVANIPEDMDRMQAWNPSDPFDFVDAFANANVLLGFNPVDPENTNIARPETIPGMGATEAWKYTAGRPDVIIAVADTGIEQYDLEELAENFYLNKEELPPPTDNGQPCLPDIWDCNDDNKFNIRDYDNDPAFSSLGRQPNVLDLIEIFSDGIDDDNNGFTDDICGWDFLRDTNVALGVRDFPEGGHGEDRAKDAAAIAENGNGDKPGFCPRCSILPIRVSDSVMSEMNALGAGVKYGAEMGAAVAVFASASLDYSGDINRLLTEISESGTVLVGVASDELSYHHAYTGSCDDVINIKAIFPIPPIDFLGFFPMEVFGFTETFCTMWGEGIHLAASSGACSSEAAGNAAGIAGLIISRARDLNIDLTANEVKQIMTMSADDIYRFCLPLTGGGCQRGWDAHFGYGRPNLATAFEMLGDPPNGIPSKIPPEVKITSPKWFTIFDPVQNPAFDVEAYLYSRGRQFDWELQVAVGKEPMDGEFATIATGSSTGQVDKVIGSVDISTLLTPDVYQNPPIESFDFTVTLKLKASYSILGEGQIFGEDRRTFAIHRDQDEQTGLMPGFPMDLDASGEGSVVMYDIDGDLDRRLEIIVNTSKAQVLVYKYDNSSDQYQMMDGFPVNIIDYTASVAPTDITLATPAVGDLFGNGTPYIIVGTGSGAIFAIHPNGNLHTDSKANPSPVLDGFPVWANELDNTSAESYAHGRSFGSSPVLSDLDNDGLLEIIAASYDGNVYAWKSVDGDGDGFADLVGGFPVFAKSEAGNVSPNKVCPRADERFPPQILGTPAVGIFDPDSVNPDISEYPSIFIGTSEVCEDSLLKSGRFYGIYHDGYNNKSGSAFLPGWPVKITAPLGDALPIPPVTIGITSSPAMARHNGKTYFGIGSVAWFPQLLEFDGNDLRTINLPSKISFNLLGHGSFGRMAGDDKLHYILPTTSAIDMIDGWISLLRPILVAWDMDDLSQPAMTADLEDSNWYANAAIADIDNDGMAEAIAGTGGFMVHAIDLDSNEPVGWPKFTYNWSVSAPIVGDIDGDGLFEIINHTREGFLFGWETEGEACNENGTAAQWWSFHHDEWNTGLWGKDTQPPGVVTDLSAIYNHGSYRIRFTSPGDDWWCGIPAAYDIRYASTPDELTQEAFFDAQTLDESLTPSPDVGYEKISFNFHSDESDLWFAVQTVDDQGNLSLISQPFESKEIEGDDDDSGDNLWGTSPVSGGCCGCE